MQCPIWLFSVVLLLLLLLLIIIINSVLLVIRWQFYGKPRSQQEIKTISPSTLRMLCAVRISVVCSSSMADGDLEAIDVSDLILPYLFLMLEL